MITKELFDSGYRYEGYRKMIDELYEQGKTTGIDHSEAMLDYTKMNVHRMSRLDKTIELDNNYTDRVKNLNQKLHWLVLTEAWCGDAAQNIPILSKMADVSPNIELRLILRDENPEVMDNYLTNGGRSIPKLIVLDEEFNEVATWGPRPAEVQQMVLDNKKSGAMDYSEFAKVVQKWYAKNKGKNLQREMLNIIDEYLMVLDE